jgi:non-specific serine/threonine protein kinase
MDQADYARARGYLEESLALARELSDRHGLANVLEGFAALAAARKSPRRALRLLGAAQAVREAIGGPLPPDWQADLERRLSPAWLGLDAEAATAACAEGRSTPLEQALSYALAAGEIGRRSAPPGTLPEAPSPGAWALEELTTREREVVALLARGLSNRQIAATLVVSERTAEGHVHNILSKLQLDSRTQLASWGVRMGLVGVEAPAPDRAVADRYRRS